MNAHWIWWTLTMICIIWYSTVTVYVAIRGAADIKGMLGRLSELGDEDGDNGNL